MQRETVLPQSWSVMSAGRQDTTVAAKPVNTQIRRKIRKKRVSRPEV